MTTKIDGEIEGKRATLDNPLAVQLSKELVNAYSVHDVAVVSSTTYVGKETAEGKWLIVSIDESSGTVLRYANVSNNSGYTTYSSAWTARASLTYDYIENLTGV